MDLVAFTDHDSIDGALELLDAPAGRDDVIVGEEVSCRLPDGDIEVHLGVYGMTEALHRDAAAAARATSSTSTARLREARRLLRAESSAAFLSRADPARRATCGCSTRCRRSKSATARCCRRTTCWSSGSPERGGAGAGARSAMVAGSDAHTLRRVGTTWTEAPGRDARRVPAPACAQGSGVPGGRARHARRPSPATPTASSRRTSPRSPASARAISRAGAAPRAWRSRRCRCRFSSCRWRSRRRARRASARGRGTSARRRRGRRRGAGRARADGVAVMSDARRDHRHRPGHGARRDARGELAAHARRRMRHPPGDASSTPRAIAAASPPKSTWTAVDAGSTPLERRRRSRSDRIGVRAAAEALADAGLLDSGIDRSRVGVFLGAGTADLLRNEDFYRTWITAGLAPHAPSDVVEPLSEHAGRRHRRAVRPRRAARLRRRGLLVEHDRDRPRRRGDSRGPRRRGARRRHRRAVAADLQRLQPAAADGSGAVPAVRSQPRRHEHRRRRRHPGARGSRRAPRAAARTIYAELAGHGLGVRGVPPDRAGAGGQAGRGGRRRWRSRDAGINADEVRSHQRARHRDAAERRGRSARVPARVRRPRRPHSGHVDQVDDRPLPRRGRRGRGGGAGAHRRARRDPADDPPRRDRRATAPSTSSPTRRASSAVRCARVDVARVSAATTRRS